MEMTSLEYFRFVMYLALLSTSGFAPHFFALMLSTLLNIYFITLLFVYVYFFCSNFTDIVTNWCSPFFETTIAWSSYLNSYAMYRIFLIKFIAQCTSFRRHQRTMKSSSLPFALYDLLSLRLRFGLDETWLSELLFFLCSKVIVGVYCYCILLFFIYLPNIYRMC